MFTVLANTFARYKIQICSLITSCYISPISFLGLQAIISQWDSHIELQRASFPGRHRGNVLLEQEKQRTLALQREELASFHKLQSQHRQEQQRWERERERHCQHVEATEARLRQREEECRRLEVKCCGADCRRLKFIFVLIVCGIFLICNEKK